MDEHSTQLQTELFLCDGCGAAIAGDARFRTSDGRFVCLNCFGDQQPLVSLGMDREETLAPQTGVTCACALCQREFPVEQLHESRQQMICTQCLEHSAAGAPTGGLDAVNHEIPAGEGTGGTVMPAPGPAAAPKPQLSPRPALLVRVTCPHCWQRFEPQDVLWIGKHPDLTGDPIVGDSAPLRFLPSHFTLEGLARDPRGMTCEALACPHCHLAIPRAMLEAEPLFISIAGAPGSGKSCFLAAMTWELRRMLPKHFGVSFTDADPASNTPLTRNEETLFLAPDPQQRVRLEKTPESGEALYDRVRLHQQWTGLPRPLLLTMRPASRHPNAALASQLTRIVCLYDHAGEHFNPGQPPAMQQLTRHLGSARVMMFVYDPTQDPRFRARCADLSNDPQISPPFPTRRQESFLLETLSRARQFGGLPATQPIDRPMLVVVTKADVWGKMAALDLASEPIVPASVSAGILDGVDLNRIEGVSTIVRELMMDLTPEFVSCVEESCTKVLYVPVSALGASPEAVDGREGLWTRPIRLDPQWVTVPFLYMFARWSHDLIGGVRAS